MDTQNDALEKVIPLHILPFFGDPCYISEGYLFHAGGLQDP